MGRNTATALSRPAHLWFAGVAIAAYVTAITLAGLLPRLGRPNPVALGLTIDLIVVVPLAFYLLVVRSRGLPFVALAPVLALGFVTASWSLPAGHRQPLRVLETLAVPLEIGLIGWIVWRAARAVGRTRHDGELEPLVRIHRAASDLVRQERAAAMLASEVAVFYFAIGAWRAEPHAPPGVSCITHHVRSGHGGIVLALLLLVAVEGFAVHFLLAGWSPIAAWCFTIGSAYTLVWLVADYRATVLRPILVGANFVDLRAGLRWTLRVPRARVLDVVREKPDLGRETLNLTFFGTPTHWVVFSQPMTALGPYGLRRRVRAVGIEPDAGSELLDVSGDRGGAKRDPESRGRPTPASDSRPTSAR